MGSRGGGGGGSRGGGVKGVVGVEGESVVGSRVVGVKGWWRSRSK